MRFSVKVKKPKKIPKVLRLQEDDAGTVHQCEHNLLLKVLKRFDESELEKWV